MLFRPETKFTDQECDEQTADQGNLHMDHLRDVHMKQANEHYLFVYFPRYTMHMETLADVIKNRTWFNVKATAHAHKLPFNTHQNKEQVQARLLSQIEQQLLLRKQVNRLSQFEKQALMVLHNGPLLYAQYVGVFGGMRKYRPWRDDSPRHPWRKPISTTEKLWYLALIAVKDGRVYAPREVLDLLSLPTPPPSTHGVSSSPLVRGTQSKRSKAEGVHSFLLTDIAVLLGLLLREDIAPRWERWLGLDVADQSEALRAGLDNWALLLRYRIVQDKVSHCTAQWMPRSAA